MKTSRGAAAPSLSCEPTVCDLVRPLTVAERGGGGIAFAGETDGIRTGLMGEDVACCPSLSASCGMSKKLFGARELLPCDEPDVLRLS